MPVMFDLRLVLQHSDHVVVSAVLEPSQEGTLIDSVALQMVGSKGEAVSAKMVLPISGQLKQSMTFTLEMRPLDGDIPVGSRVVAVAWIDREPLQAWVPTHPYTQLHAHLSALQRLDPNEGERQLEPLSPEERERLAEEHPWVNEPRMPVAHGLLEVVEHEPDEDEALDDLVGDLGLDADSAEWLKDLMTED